MQAACFAVRAQITWKPASVNPSWMIPRRLGSASSSRMVGLGEGAVVAVDVGAWPNHFKLRAIKPPIAAPTKGARMTADTTIPKNCLPVKDKTTAPADRVLMVVAR